MSEEIKNVSRDGGLPILDLSHLDPIEGITNDDIQSAAVEQEIDEFSNFEVRLPQLSSDGELIISANAFTNKPVTKVYGLNKVTKIGDYAFESCMELSGKLWLDSCTELGSRSFMSCNNITEVVLSSNLEALNDYCFCRCGNLTKVYNLNKVPYIGSGAFMESGLQGKIWIDSCRDLGYGYTFGNTAITEVVLSPNLGAISDSCFSGCSNLKKVHNLNKTQVILDNAFTGSGIEGKIFLDSCEELGFNSFKNCPNLTSVSMSEFLYNHYINQSGIGSFFDDNVEINIVS
jgi:hypothetical protein